MANHSHDVDIYNDGFGYLVICVQCGKEFESKRYDSAFCSSTCRSRHHRASKKHAKDIQKVHDLLDGIIKRLPQRGESKTYTELNKMVARIEGALSYVEGDY